MLKVLLCMGFLSSTVLAQGFGGGGFGGGFGGTGFGGQSLDQNVIQSEDCMIVVARSRKVVTGFSNMTGEVDKVEFVEAPEQIIPIIGGEVVCFVNGNEAYGFSATTGKWGKVKIDGDGSDAPILPTLGRNMACFSVGDFAYAFPSDHGKWLKTKIDGDGPHTPVVSGNSVQVWTDKAIYVCSAASQRWQIMER